MLKALDVECGLLRVCEDEEYKCHLGRREYDGGDIRPVGLYGVAFVSPFKTEQFHVIAQTEADAISQACCAFGVDEDECEAKSIRTWATRLPLLIRGWGKSIF